MCEAILFMANVTGLPFKNNKFYAILAIFFQTTMALMVTTQGITRPEQQ
jgi:hypothetical protein